jgi:hypothetical protein
LPRSHCSRNTTFRSAFSPLQQSCRQTYAETALLPFSTVNRFWYYDPRGLDFFRILVSNEWPSPLGSLELGRLEGLEQFQGLKKVTLFLELEGLVDLSLEQVDDVLEELRIASEEHIRKVTPEGMEIVYTILYWGSFCGRSLRSGDGGCFFHAITYLIGFDWRIKNDEQTAKTTQDMPNLVSHSNEIILRMRQESMCLSDGT